MPVRTLIQITEWDGIAAYLGSTCGRTELGFLSANCKLTVLTINGRGRSAAASSAKRSAGEATLYNRFQFGNAGLYLAGLLLIPFLMVTIDAPLLAAIGTIDGNFKTVVDLYAETGDSKFSLILLAAFIAVLMGAYLFDTSVARARLTVWLAGACGFVFVAIAYSGILTNLIKIPVGRARPYVAEFLGWPEFSPFAVSGSFHSFPSGHANTAFAIALAVGFFVPVLRRYLLVLAAGVALCRVLQFRHFISDSVGGAMLALVTTMWLRTVFARYGIVFRLRKDGTITLAAPGRLLRRLVRRRFRAASGEEVVAASSATPAGL
jgi:undecaprenyl-diphosphatase